MVIEEGRQEDMRHITVRENIQRAMGREHLNVPALARKIECSEGALYNYFAGRSEIKVDMLERIMGVLQMEITMKG